MNLPGSVLDSYNPSPDDANLILGQVPLLVFTTLLLLMFTLYSSYTRHPVIPLLSTSTIPLSGSLPDTSSPNVFNSSTV